MELSDSFLQSYTKRLLLSRMRILCNNGFYGLLLMHVKFALDETCKTAATDGEKIYFNPAFLDRLSEAELDFVLLHELLHIVLEHVFRQGDKEDMEFNIACDIVVNSNILLSNDMKLQSITINGIGAAMHKAPNGEEGYRYTVENVYGMLKKAVKREKKQLCSAGKMGIDGGFDEHGRWGKEKGKNILRDEWRKHLKNACESVKITDPANQRGLIPMFAERMLTELTEAKTDWRTLLCDFVEEEITDYSFSPPDRRFDDSPFFLPDFNDKDECVRKMLFMIDTSGSMSDEMMTAAFSEIKGAIEQYDGKLEGWLGFFDAEVIAPKPFENVKQLLEIRPQGGGGTSFDVIFEYVFSQMNDERPVSIIILTDGEAPFPSESAACQIPVLWLINNEEVTPPWGKVARIAGDFQ